MLNNKVLNLKSEEVQTQLQSISSKSLTSGEKYQRLLKPYLIKDIVEDFDPHQLGTISVSYRDEKYNIFDGQNRFTALKQINEGRDFLVPCVVHYGLTKAAEAILVGKIRGNHKQMSLIDTFKALYIGEDPKVVSIVQTVEKAGLEVSFSSGKGNNKVVAIKAIERIYNDLGESGLENVLKLIKNTWFGVSSSLDKHILIGTYLLIKTYGESVNDKIFIKNLSKVEPMMIKRMGDSDMITKGELKYAKAIFECYNKKQTVKTKLEYKFKG